MNQYDYDLFIIGAGSGGVRASRIAANLGAKVAISEEYRVGGTCVIRGCVPKKIFVYASEFSKNFSIAKNFGWSIKETSFNWSTLIKNKNFEIKRLENIYCNNLHKNNVKIIYSKSIIKDKHTIFLVDKNKTITTKYILIATGSTPFKPNIEGSEFAITSNEVFNFEKLPKDIVIIGGGYIAVEFAGIFNGLGVNTHLFYRGNKILRNFDIDLQKNLTYELISSGIDVRTMTNVIKINKQCNDLLLYLNNDKIIKTNKIMYATGRIPYVQNLGLKNVGIKQGKKGEILINSEYQTNINNIYAIGDVTDRINLTPVAIREGNIVAENLFNNKLISINYDLIPKAIFSQPEIGTIGLTEDEARKKFININIYESIFSSMKSAFSKNNDKVLMKLIVDQKTDKVLGVHIMGSNASEMIQLIGIAMHMGVTKKNFDKTMAVHPTLSEELVTMNLISRT